MHRIDENECLGREIQKEKTHYSMNVMKSTLMRNVCSIFWN